MVPFLFRCPRTGLMVQALIENTWHSGDDSLVPLTCNACGSVHLVDPKAEALRDDHSRRSGV